LKTKIGQWQEEGRLPTKKIKKADMDYMVTYLNQHEEEDASRLTFKYHGFEVSHDKLRRHQKRFGVQPQDTTNRSYAHIEIIEVPAISSPMDHTNPTSQSPLAPEETEGTSLNMTIGFFGFTTPLNEIRDRTANQMHEQSPAIKSITSDASRIEKEGTPINKPDAHSTLAEAHKLSNSPSPRPLYRKDVSLKLDRFFVV
jgi:hypothetical protein